MDYCEFDKRVRHNTRVLKKALKDGVNVVSIAPQFYTWGNKPGELHASILMKNLHDIIPSAFLGVLASTAANGADGYEVSPDNTITLVELKTGSIASSTVWKGERGGLYVGHENTKDRRCAISSRLCASYNLKTEGNLESKKIRTVIFVSDTDDLITTLPFIDAWEMRGDDIGEYLRRSDNTNRTIKLGSFMKKGARCQTTVKLPGFHKLQERLNEIALPHYEYFEKLALS